MKIHLQYETQPQGQVQAAYLRGHSLGEWLPEIARWGISMDQLRCYVVPLSLSDRSPAGLLVILPHSLAELPAGQALPCYLLGNRLALPLEASLQPALSAAEIDKLLLFPIQFFHPSLGMVGWEAHERLDIGALLAMGPETQRSWNLAHPGNAAAPPLHSVKVPQPSMEEALQALEEGIDRRPLSDLDDKQPKDDDSPWGRFKAGLFKGGLQMTKGIMDQFPEGNGEAGEGYLAFAKLAGWLGDKLGSGLQDQRSDALDKLMDLFATDPDQALRYAIPLDNPYQNRGMGSAGGSLSERDINFNLGRIGGGLGGNTWNVESTRYQSLRERYLKAANEAIARKDFAKAAYIYAHLLHDLNGAANVLEQGRMYREAAAIYKEHLKNLPKAADCLEKGGLYLDAIDIYLELKQWEKAGDLYAQIGKREKADLQYERCVEAAMEQADYLEACRLLTNKMNREDRALVTLLQGWQDDKQSEACLQRYLDAVSRLPDIDMGQQLEMLHQQHTPAHREGSFLTVVATNVQLYKTEAAKTRARNIAYEILSKQALQGDNTHLGLLQRFLASDSLIGNDISRFNTGFKKDFQQAITVPQLNKNILWLGCKSLGSQVLAYGREGNHLWMARFNWQGHVEYYHWPEDLGNAVAIHLILPAGNQGTAFLVSNGVAHLSRKSLPVNERFSTAIDVAGLVGLGETNQQTRGIVQLPGGGVFSLFAGSTYGSLKRFNQEGALQEEIYCKDTNGELFYLDPESSFHPMLELAGDFVHLEDHNVLLIDALATTKVFPLAHHGLKFAISAEYDPRKLCAVATIGGCQILSLAGEPGGIAPPLLLGSLAVSDVCFLPGKLLVILYFDPEDVVGFAGYSVAVYDMNEDRPVLEMKFDPEFEPSAIIPGPQRRSFCLVGQRGMVKAYTLEERMDGW